MFVQHQDPVWRQIITTDQSGAGQIIVHGFEELDADLLVVMVEQK
jgi:hypothetical protein